MAKFLADSGLDLLLELKINQSFLGFFTRTDHGFDGINCHANDFVRFKKKQVDIFKRIENLTLMRTE
jgi:hypothetical protein